MSRETTNDSINTLMRAAADGAIYNDTFRAETGQIHLISGLKEALGTGENYLQTFRETQEELEKLIDEKMKDNGDILIPNNQHYGESQIAMESTDIILLTFNLDRSMDSVWNARTLIPSHLRLGPSRFLIPLKGKRKNLSGYRYAWITFGTGMNLKPTIMNCHKSYVKWFLENK